MQRRDFFKSFAKPFKEKDELVVRPPYFLDEDDFKNGCIDCVDKACATICEEKIIIIQPDGTPKLDFTKSGCSYCDECANACIKDVLKIENRKNIQVEFSIDRLKCMSWNNTMCFSCKDPCLDNAIDFTAMFRPIIDISKCTSCGYCVGVCPTDAIKLEVRS
jgi:ferredoxin-type protein NapF